SGMGRIDKLWIEANGTGNIELNDIVTSDAEILLSGRGRVTVTVTEKLEATNIGRGEIIYAGNPPKTTIDNSGQGIIRRKYRHE
ncbi:MAG: DUF2807 domain-containing protein, partial [Candidatus Omnitrophica bacterium]|nr:DUF2807 domain-containing protein [Candidatus Omnitrophota bacterium]